jgi:serine/threonine protein kinase
MQGAALRAGCRDSIKTLPLLVQAHLRMPLLKLDCHIIVHAWHCLGACAEAPPSCVLACLQGPLSKDKLSVLLPQLCLSMQQQAACGIVHNDLKLENIAWDADMRLRIFDYGYASCAGDPIIAFAGTPLFMAPELLCFGGNRGRQYSGPQLDW